MLKLIDKEISKILHSKLVSSNYCLFRPMHMTGNVHAGLSELGIPFIQGSSWALTVGRSDFLQEN